MPDDRWWGWFSPISGPYSGPKPDRQPLPKIPTAYGDCPHCGGNTKTCGHKSNEKWQAEFRDAHRRNNYRTLSEAWPNGRTPREQYSAEQGTGQAPSVVYTGRRMPR